MRCIVIWFAVFTVFAIILAIDPNTSKYLAEAKLERAKADIRALSKAAGTYKLRQGIFPMGLKDLVGGGYIEHEAKNPLRDPWGNEYQYDPKGTRSGGNKPDIWTFAPDGLEIASWGEQNK